MGWFSKGLGMEPENDGCCIGMIVGDVGVFT